MLTNDAIEHVRTLLKNYTQETRSIVARHKLKMQQIIETIDQRQTERLRQRLQFKK
jgi:hypothetical protein